MPIGPGSSTGNHMSWAMAEPGPLMSHTDCSVALTEGRVRYIGTPSQVKNVRAPVTKPAWFRTASSVWVSKSISTRTTLDAGKRSECLAMVAALARLMAARSTSYTGLPANDSAKRYARVSYPAPRRTTCSAPSSRATSRLSSMKR